MTPVRIDHARHLLLDRDGVLNVESVGAVLRHRDQWRWERAALPALHLVAEQDIAVSVVTNQSAVARGCLDRDELEHLHEWLGDSIRRTGVRLVGIFSCAHEASDRCRCRKPAPGMLLEAIETSGIEAAATLMVGDDLRDLQAADAAGIASMLVRTGKGRSVEAVAGPDTNVVDDLYEAVKLLVERGGNETQLNRA